MATSRQLTINARHKRTCGALGIASSTLKHRGEQGATVAVGKNLHYEQSDPFTTLPATTDSQVWAVWIRETIRSTSAEGGDTAAGLMWTERIKGQCPALDVDGNEVVLYDDDWLQTDDTLATLFLIENPTLTPDQSLWEFSLITQQ